MNPFKANGSRPRRCGFRGCLIRASWRPVVQIILHKDGEESREIFVRMKSVVCSEHTHHLNLEDFGGADRFHRLGLEAGERIFSGGPYAISGPLLIWHPFPVQSPKGGAQE